MALSPEQEAIRRAQFTPKPIETMRQRFNIPESKESIAWKAEQAAKPSPSGIGTPPPAAQAAKDIAPSAAKKSLGIGGKVLRGVTSIPVAAGAGLASAVGGYVADTAKRVGNALPTGDELGSGMDNPYEFTGYGQQEPSTASPSAFSMPTAAAQTIGQPPAPTIQGNEGLERPVIERQPPAPTIQQPTVYTDQGVPGSAGSTIAGMSAPAAPGGSQFDYGNEQTGVTRIVGTNTPRQPIATAVKSAYGDPSTAPQPNQAVYTPQTSEQAAGYGIGGRAGGMKQAFSSTDIADINAKIRGRVDKGAPNTFVGIGKPKTPEQQAAEDQRFAQGTEVANKYIADAAALDAKNAPAPSGYQPTTIAGALVQQGAANRDQAATEKARSLSIQERAAGVQERTAAEQAASSAGQAQERGVGIKQKQAQMAEEAKIQGLRQKLSSTTNEAERKAISQQINDLSGDKTRQDPLSSRVNAARAILGDMDATPEERTQARTFLSSSLGEQGGAQQQADPRQQEGAILKGKDGKNYKVVNGQPVPI